MRRKRLILCDVVFFRAGELHSYKNRSKLYFIKFVSAKQVAVMWGIFVGLGLGAFEVLLLKKLITAMTSDRKNTAFAIPLTIAKLVLILVVLWLMAAFVSLEAMAWCAAGAAAAMIGIPVALSIRTIKKYRQHGGEQR